MAKAARKRPVGRPRLLTRKAETEILRVVNLGGSIKMAAACAGVSQMTLLEWIRRGEGRDGRGPDEQFTKFAEAIRSARSRGDVTMLNAVRGQVEGFPCKACEDGTISGDDGKERCPACRGSGFAAKPDGRLSLEMLARRHPELYGRKDRMKIDATVSGTVAVDVTVKALAVDLTAMSPEQLQALAWGTKAIEVAEE